MGFDVCALAYRIGAKRVGMNKLLVPEDVRDAPALRVRSLMRAATAHLLAWSVPVLKLDCAICAVASSSRLSSTTIAGDSIQVTESVTCF